MLKYDVCFSGSRTCVFWQGNRVTSRDEFAIYLRSTVRGRLIDDEHRIPFESDLRALATTDMASDTLRQLLSFEPSKEPWEVGEALAECLLEEEYSVKWPWNMERDKRAPKASLPGADLIGFIRQNDESSLLIGEVKTSNDSSAPPQVLYGRSGMIHQLDRLASNLEIHWQLIKWLHVRCKNTDILRAG
ncbi:MAG: hypothetical protein L0229_05210 [Blastocatellia bacterium]|nr:hypothetical protein [Blastocatellia bacterium]